MENYDNKLGITQEVFSLFEKVGSVIEKKGTKATTITAGITIIMILLSKSVYTPETSFNRFDLALIIIASILILSGLIISCMEVRWYNSFKIKEKEIIQKSIEAEFKYNLERFLSTNPQHHQDRGGMIDTETISPPEK